MIISKKTVKKFEDTDKALCQNGHEILYIRKNVN